jgi:hypothetical protein
LIRSKRSSSKIKFRAGATRPRHCARSRQPAPPKFDSPANPAPRRISAYGGQDFFAYPTNDRIDVEATTVNRQVEVLAAKRMIEHSIEHFGIYPAHLIGDTAYGLAEILCSINA